MNFINVDKLYYAIMTKDDGTGVAYGAPKAMPGAVKIAVDAANGRAAFYADGGIQEYGQTLGEIKVTLDVSTVPLAIQADILGHTLDGVGGMVNKVTDQAPYVALMYRRKKSNGKFRYIKVLKCLFGESKDDAETATASPKFQNDNFSGVALPRVNDGKWKAMADEEEIAYVDVSATWFTAVEGIDVTPPSIVSSVPTVNAVAISVNTTYQWVFTESINPATVNVGNFYLIKDTDGSLIAGTTAYNDLTKTVTFTPSGALSAATRYAAIADGDVSDLAGNKLIIATRFFTTD
jgi:phi13 family phage major tail protein